MALSIATRHNLCETAFSTLKTIQSENRSTFRDADSEMHVGLSIIRPHIEKLCELTAPNLPLMKFAQSIGLLILFIVHL